MLIKIFTYLNPSEKCAVKEVCKEWNRICWEVVALLKRDKMTFNNICPPQIFFQKFNMMRLPGKIIFSDVRLHFTKEQWENIGIKLQHLKIAQCVHNDEDIEHLFQYCKKLEFLEYVGDVNKLLNKKILVNLAEKNTVHKKLLDLKLCPYGSLKDYFTIELMSIVFFIFPELEVIQNIRLSLKQFAEISQVNQILKFYHKHIYEKIRFDIVFLNEEDRRVKEIMICDHIADGVDNLRFVSKFES